MEQGRRAGRHALGLRGGTISPLLPNGIYTIPEVSMVGETEESLKKKGIAYIVGNALQDRHVERTPKRSPFVKHAGIERTIVQTLEGYGAHAINPRK
jgi:pyruvate/2-oxoglutarate dehydrogenase complex dihydrolipoamide dehydrogenase (E3) component